MNLKKRRAGVAIIIGCVGLAGLLMLLWLAGLVMHVGGGLIHLLLLLAMLVGPTGLALGVVLVIIAGREN
ncbi:MAG: hypothetical protein QOE33_1566 [Acidobacteriota bacterium]|nr:hypothetical protein [Acidobacteriota bacterium]